MPRGRSSTVYQPSNSGAGVAGRGITSELIASDPHWRWRQRVGVTTPPASVNTGGAQARVLMKSPDLFSRSTRLRPWALVLIPGLVAFASTIARRRLALASISCERGSIVEFSITEFQG